MFSTLILSLLLSASSDKPAEALSRSIPDSARKITSLSASSPDSLVAEIIEALNVKDARHLFALSFNKDEFLTVYPFFETDTSASRREFAMQFYLMDNWKILERQIGANGGNKLTLSRYEIEGPLETYGPMILYKGFHIWIKKDSVENEIRLIKSAAKFHDGWKIWSFRDD